MKKVSVLLLICFASQFNYSQENYTVGGETLPLKIEIDGQLDLLWNIIDNNYRYFVRTEDGSITELKNTKDADKNYQEQYKVTLSGLTNGSSTEKLKLTLYSLRNYIDKYNASVDSAYTSTLTESKVQFRLAFFGGITNAPFVNNPNNVKLPIMTGEIEIFEANILPRHSGFIQGRHTFDSEDFSYSNDEISIGYRYKIINKSSFSVYGQVKFATLNRTQFTFKDENGTNARIEDTAFDVPFIFGIGTDIKVSKNGFITLIYGELFAAFFDNQGNFSTDISLGYKFNL
jgi:hypothetical protein